MNRTRQTVGRLLAVLVALAALVGCSPVGVGTVETEYSPPLSDDTMFIPYGSIAFTEDGLLFLVLGGSSSCHPYPTGIDIDDDGAMSVHIGRPWALACTADSAMITYRLPVETVPTELTLVSDDYRETLQVISAEEQ